MPLWVKNSTKPSANAPVQKIPTTPTEYPDGVIVKTESGHWYIKGKSRFLVPTDRVLKSWAVPFVITSTDAALTKYAKAGKVGFRGGSFLYNDGKYYFVSGSTLRKISSPDVFITMGLDTRAAMWVSDDELKLHKAGEVF